MTINVFRNVHKNAHQITWDLARHIHTITRATMSHVWIGRGWDPKSSEHKTGRALDIIVVPSQWLNRKRASGKYLQSGNAIAKYLIKHAWTLDIRHIIWNGKIWKRRYVSQGWQPLQSYRTGVSDGHYDHIHVFLQSTRGAIPADTLAPNKAVAVPPKPVGSNARPFSIGNVLASRAKNSYHVNVEIVQRALNALYLVHGQGRLKIDGYWGSTDPRYGNTQRVYDAYRRKVLKYRKKSDYAGAPGAVSMNALLSPTYYIV